MSTPKAALVVVPPPMKSSLPLYQLEDLLVTYAETADCVPADQEEEFYQQFAALIKEAAEKRDRMGQFMAHLESQIQFADAEIKRLQERKHYYAKVYARVEAYLVRILQSLGKDPKGKPKKLEGHTTTFSLHRNPPSVSITDETQIPEAYKTASVALKLPAEQWAAFLDTLDLEARALVMDGARVTLEPSKTAIKAALESDTPVPGAEISPENYRLVRS